MMSGNYTSIDNQIVSRSVPAIQVTSLSNSKIQTFRHFLHLGHKGRLLVVLALLVMLMICDSRKWRNC